MGRRKQLKEHDLLEAIKGSRGFKSTIAARLHVDWHTVDKAINASEKAQQVIKDEEETTLDLVEGKALSKINDGDGAMIRFYLATKGKKRGYTYEDGAGNGDDATHTRNGSRATRTTTTNRLALSATARK